MSINELAIPLVAKALGKRMNVKVEFGHEQPRTNGKCIFLPHLPLDDPKTRLLGLGFVAHEAAHVRFTDFEVGGVVSKLHHHLRGIFEDIRIEKKLMGLYPGAGKVLRELVDSLVEDNFFGLPSDEDTPAQVISRYMLYTLRASVLEQTALLPLANASSENLEKAVSTGGITRLHSVMSRVVTSSSTQDAHNLALEVLSILEDEIEPPEEEDDSQENDDSNDDESTGTGDDKTQQEVTSDPCPDKNAVQAMLDATDGDMDADMFESLVASELQDAIDDVVESGDICYGEGLADKPPLPLGNHSEVYNKAHQQTYALRTRLQSFVQASKRVKRGTSQNGQRLHDKKLYRVKTGNPSIYKSKSKKRAVNTVVQILMDRSYSMDDRMDLATNATLAVAAALETIPGVRVAASAFPGRIDDVEPMTLFGESVKQTAARYPAIMASGGTPLLPALLWSTEQLMNCKEERKLLLIVTDGAPDDPQECKKVIAQMRANNIETMGLGIHVSSVKELFPISECITEETQLATAMFSMLQENLLNLAA